MMMNDRYISHSRGGPLKTFSVCCSRKNRHRTTVCLNYSNDHFATFIWNVLDMASVSASSNNEFPESSDKHGEVVFSGGASWSMTGRSSATKSFDGVPADQILLSFHRLKPMMNIPVAKVICGPLANHSLIIDSRGFAYAWGRNEDGQLGVGDTTNRYNPV